MAMTEAIDVTKIWSATGLWPSTLIQERPFRAPHHSASITALIGGGPDPRPGEISLAHRGILFLDELPEFQKNTLEALRQPLESGTVRLSRAKTSIELPAKFTLIAAMNPCQCGYYGDPEKECKCTPYEVLKYQKKISGPLLDRIDIQIKVGRVKIEELRKNIQKNDIQKGVAITSGSIKSIVENARKIQSDRFSPQTARTNSEMTSREIRTMTNISPDGQRFLETFDKTRLSPRGYHRLLKVARTIADIEGCEKISTDHLAEAFGYRLKEEL